MIVVVQEHNAHQNAHLLDQMFRLRARVFAERLKWDVSVVDGKERDRFDDLAPVYLIYTDEEGLEVRGSLRLLPTTGPTVLADFFTDTMPDAALLSAPTIWECTRFCVDEDRLRHREQIVASRALISGLGSVALAAGIEFDPRQFRRQDAQALSPHRLRGGCAGQHPSLRGAGLSRPVPGFADDPGGSERTAAQAAGGQGTAGERSRRCVGRLQSPGDAGRHCPVVRRTSPQMRGLSARMVRLFNFASVAADGRRKSGCLRRTAALRKITQG